MLFCLYVPIPIIPIHSPLHSEPKIVISKLIIRNISITGDLYAYYYNNIVE